MFGKVQKSKKKTRCFMATDKKTGAKKQVCITSSGKRKKRAKKAKA